MSRLLRFSSLRNAQTIEPTTAWTAVSPLVQAPGTRAKEGSSVILVQMDKMMDGYMNQLLAFISIWWICDTHGLIVDNGGSRITRDANSSFHKIGRLLRFPRHFLLCTSNQVLLIGHRNLSIRGYTASSSYTKSGS